MQAPTAMSNSKNGEAKVFHPPFSPDNIKCVKATQSTISLEWTRPQQGSDSVHHYTVEYCEEKHVSLGYWKTKATKGKETCIEVDNLRSATSYCFKVRAECESGVSEFSRVSSPISTCKSDRLAEVMKAVSQQSPPESGRQVYKVCGDEIDLPGKMLHKVAIGEAKHSVPEKVLMLLGTAGAGKSTLINGMINYIFGVQWKDNFRFKLITEVAKSQAHGQTSAITAYIIHHMDGSRVNYNLTIIDTPGIRDSSGLEQDRDITRQIKEFFSVVGQNGISHLNGIGFVSQSSLARLTPTQQHIFDSILSIFGKDVAQNIFIMVTFSDRQRPPVMSAIEEAHIPHKEFFKFNNSALFGEAGVKDNDDEVFWKMGVSSFKKFFTAFQKAEVASLTITEDVLKHPPSSPEDVKCVNATQSTISLEWAKPQQAYEGVHHYTVEYCEEKDVSLGHWKTKATKGDETFVEVGNLRSATSYCFKVRTECKSGVSEFSKVSIPISTHESDRLAEVMKAVSQQIPNKSGRPTYKVCGEEIDLPGKMLHKVAIGEARPGVPEKVLMVLGATGAGKSTLINGMINYIFGVQWKDNFRFKLITEIAKSQAHSQTSTITAYTIYKMDGSKVDYNLTIIDTPGFGDTSGLERDKDITRQIKEFFSIRGRDGISHLNGIGFVSQSALARLTPTQRYIFDSILSIFGKNVAQNIFIMVTFSDGQKPPVMSAIEEAHIPHKEFFKFNNSALFAEAGEKDDEDNFDEMFWKMGVSSFKKFFTAFQKAEDVSITMTKDVLNLRQHLETIVVGLQLQMKECLVNMEVLRQERIILKDHEKDISANKDFTYEIMVPYYRTEKLPKDEFVTNCLRCSMTCHYPCGIADNDNKKLCAAMDQTSDPPKCTVCSEGCLWFEHKNTGERFILEQRKETRTSDDLKKKFESATQEKATVEEMLANHQHQLEEAHALLHELVEESQKCLDRLDQIALKPNPLTQVEYIELLISSEKQQAKEGWMDRVSYLETTKEQAKLLAIMKDVNHIDKRIEEEKRNRKEGWEQTVETLEQVKRIKVEVDNIKKERVEKGRGVWGTIKAAGKSVLTAPLSLFSKDKATNEP